jgi:hypothetical protein
MNIYSVKIGMGERKKEKDYKQTRNEKSTIITFKITTTILHPMIIRFQDIGNNSKSRFL